MVGLDPEGDDPSRFGHRPRSIDRRVKRADIGDVLVARANQQKLVVIRRGHGKRNRRRAIALHRLKQQAGTLGRQRKQLIFLRDIGDDHGRRESLAEPVDGFLKQALLAKKRKQMFRPRCGR